MSEESAATLKEIRRIIRVLERLGELARQASHHETLRDGRAYAIQQYNAIIGALAAHGIEAPGYFPPLTVDDSLGAVGFASAQLAEYLSELVETESKGSGEGGGSSDEGSFFNQFFGSGEFQHIGEAMRQAVPGFMREGRRGRADREAGRERHRSRGAADEARTAPGVASPAEGSRDDDLGRRLAEVSARMEATAALMRRPELPLEELRRLAAELARLGEEQARIGREAASGETASVNVDVDVEG